MSGSRHDRLLGRRELERAFRELEGRLASRGVRAHVYVVGGAAMVMAYRRSRTTMDVDALVIDHREAVLEAAAEVARDLRLDQEWLNDDVRTQARVPAVPDARAKVLYESPHLVVTGASEAHMLAMKVNAAREADEQDIKWLVRRVGARTMAGLEEIHRDVFRDERTPMRGYQRLARFLREVREEDRRRWRPPPRRRDYGPTR